jgi:hypothetical protein
MAPQPAVAESEYVEVLQRIQDLIQRIENRSHAFIDNVNKILAKVPAMIGDGLRKGTQKFVALMEKIFRELDKVVNKPGWPPTLLSHGNAWANQVGDPVSKLAGHAGHADHDQSTVLEQWKGDAAESYKSILGPQQKALTSIKKDLTDTIHSAMTAVTAAVIAFWASVATALAALIGGIIGAVASTATILGAPAGPFIAIAACAVFLAALAAGSGTLFAVASVQNGNLRDKLADYLAFKDGHWPRSTADRLSDATMRDSGPGGPDDSDWHVR